MLVNLQLDQAAADYQHPEAKPTRHEQYSALSARRARRWVGSSTTGHSILRTCYDVSDRDSLAAVAELFVLGAFSLPL
jgi:hypothetical protein